MAGARPGRAWGSVLSADGFAAVRSVGFEPAGQVFGAAVFPLVVTAGASCPGTGADRGRRGSSPEPPAGVTIVSGDGVPGPAARIARALTEGRQLAMDRMTAECADIGAHGIVGASMRVREIPAGTLTGGAVEFTVIGTAVRAAGCPPPGRPFACDLSGQAFARLVMAGWVPAGIVLGVSVAARHDELLESDRSRWGLGNTEVPAYTDLIVKVRQDARSRLEQEMRRLGANGAIGTSITMHVHGDACRAHPGGTDHLVQAVITASAVTRFADPLAMTHGSLAVLPLGDHR